MAGQTITSFDAMLKEYYTDDRVENLVYEDNPFLALVPKDETFPGRKLPVPVVFGNPGGRNATFSTAQTLGSAANSGSQVEQFEMTRVNDYGFVTIANELIEATMDDDGAFLEAKTAEVDGIIQALSRSLSISLFRKGYGKIGTVGSISSATITLDPLSDVHNFEKGQVLVMAATEATTALETGTVTVLSVNRSAGTVTMTGAVTSGISTAAATMAIFISGDRQNSATPSRLKVAGLEDWCPATAPSASENYFGVDRSVDSRLYGTSYNGASDDISDALITGAAKSAALGAKIDHFFLSFDKYAELEKDLQDNVSYIDLKGPAEIAFRGLVLNGPRGQIKVIADQNCPNNRAYGVGMKYLKLRSLGKVIKPIGGDGLQMLRLASEDAVEVRYAFRGNLCCNNPAALVNVQL